MVNNFCPVSRDITSARKKAGIDQGLAASFVHVSSEQWARWEAGEQPMPPAAWELFLIKIFLQKTVIREGPEIKKPLDDGSYEVTIHPCLKALLIAHDHAASEA